MNVRRLSSKRPDREALLEEVGEVRPRGLRPRPEEVVRRAALRVEVDDERPLSLVGGDRGEVADERRLPDAPLLVEDDPSHAAPSRTGDRGNHRTGRGRGRNMTPGGARVTAESLLPFFGYVGTAASAAVAAAVLASLHRARQRPWLRSWSWSWLFLTLPQPPLGRRLPRGPDRASRPSPGSSSPPSPHRRLRPARLPSRRGPRGRHRTSSIPRRRLGPVLACDLRRRRPHVAPRLFRPVGRLPPVRAPLRRSGP